MVIKLCFVLLSMLFPQEIRDQLPPPPESYLPAPPFPLPAAPPFALPWTAPTIDAIYDFVMQNPEFFPVWLQDHVSLIALPRQTAVGKFERFAPIAFFISQVPGLGGLSVVIYQMFYLSAAQQQQYSDGTVTGIPTFGLPTQAEIQNLIVSGISI